MLPKERRALLLLAASLILPSTAIALVPVGSSGSMLPFVSLTGLGLVTLFSERAERSPDGSERRPQRAGGSARPRLRAPRTSSGRLFSSIRPVWRRAS